MFTPKTFNIPELKGVSAKNIEEHMKLYQGYVKFANHILEKIDELKADSDPSTSSGQDHAYELGELQRRFAFEFDGMRNHEYYFASLEGGSTPLSDDSTLKNALALRFNSFDAFLAQFKAIALTRGVGWSMLYYDKQTGNLLTQWVEEQHLGHLVSCTPILALDMWEHAYVYDYPTSEKKKYVEAFFENLNWSKIEENFKNAQ